MSLAAKKWAPVSMHRINTGLAAGAERDRNVAAQLAWLPPLIWQPGLSALLDHPNLNDAEENCEITALIYYPKSYSSLRYRQIQDGTKCET